LSSFYLVLIRFYLFILFYLFFFRFNPNKVVYIKEMMIGINRDRPGRRRALVWISKEKKKKEHDLKGPKEDQDSEAHEKGPRHGILAAHLATRPAQPRVHFLARPV
jgi:hypothetical protein